MPDAATASRRSRCSGRPRSRPLCPAISVVALLAAGCSTAPTYDVGRPFETAEGRVIAYKLPNPLRLQNGARVKDAATWYQVRRGEILHLFRENVYGHAPGRPPGLRFHLLSVDRNALGGKATRKVVRVYFSQNTSGPKMDLYIHIPNSATKPVPLFLGLSYLEGGGIIGTKSWPMAIIDRGYGLATAYYQEIDPDVNDFQNGVHPLFYAPGQTQPKPNEWGAIGAWAWGLSRAMDYLETDTDIDAQRVAVMGHSRLGKTALWAGAQDERFAMVISNNSGEGGAELMRRKVGERIAGLHNSRPHWFNDIYPSWGNREDEIPVDQHMLIALMAPRPVYVASAEKDIHVDSLGEYLSAYYASPVYRLFGLQGLTSEAMPGVNKPILTGHVGYHIRSGRHGVTDYDWQQYLKFADRHLKH